MDRYNMLLDSFQTKYETFLTACDALEELNEWDIEEYGDMDAFYSNDLISIIIRLIAVDGSITQEEVDGINKTFDFEYTLDEMLDVYDNCIDELETSLDENCVNGISIMREINPKLADLYKELIALVCEIIMESDGVIDPREVSYVKKMKELCEQ